MERISQRECIQDSNISSTTKPFIPNNNVEESPRDIPIQQPDVSSTVPFVDRDCIEIIERMLA